MRIKFTISLMLALIFCSSVALAAKIQVPSHKYPTIQDGIDAASDGDIVIVADGIFTGLGNKDLDFNGKAITVESKNGPEYTIIDCELYGRGFYFHTGESANSVVDGFTITNGYISEQYSGGGGIFLEGSSPTIINCIISQNSGDYGAGIYCIRRSNLIIMNCIIKENSASMNGGGIRCFYFSSPIFYNCLIINNSSHGIDCHVGSSPYFINCTISGNSLHAIRMHNLNHPVMKNCILWNNNAASGVEIEINQSDPPSSLTISHSNVKGGQAAVVVDPGCVLNWGDGNMNNDPLFVGLGGDYHLTAGSPCIDTGTSDGAPDTDIDGVQRPQGAGYDMGAYEYVGTDTYPMLEIVHPNGGETLIKENDYLITWSWSDYSGDIRIHVYLDDDFYYPISNGIDVKQGRKGVEFIPPSNWDNSDNYKIHISTLDDQGSDESDGYFTIQDEITVYDYDVPYINQLDYAQWGQSACGPTCITMLERYWYPNNKIDVPEVYHAATQANSYYTNTKNGAPLIGYYNVGWAVKYIWPGTDPDTKLDRVPAEFRKYHIGTYSGMDTEYAVNYLKNIWGAEVKYIAGRMGDIIDEIKKNPVILSVNEGYGGHFIVLRGYNAETNTFYINDPYAPYHDEDGVAPWDDADNIEVSYNTLQTWFERKMMTFKPSTDHNQEVRENTVLVDNGINNFGDKDRGNLNPNCKVTSHCFEVETIDAKTADGDWIWQSYHTKGMDWIYPIYTTEDGYYVKWTPKLPVSGQYEVIVKFYGDKSQKTSVQYDIYDNLHTLLHSQEVDQSSTGYQSVSLGEYYLSDGAYVKVEDLPSSCNADAIMFKYVPTEAY